MIFQHIRNSFITRLILSYLFIYLILPVASIPLFGLTGGPTQPEFSSFEPVQTNKMINEFTGDFTYNLPVLEVPGPHGSGYPVSLSYHSGLNPEEEASWVGFGWTLNPGAIVRNKRGLPDDFKNVTVKNWNHVPRNYTISTTGKLGLAFELFSFDSEKAFGSIDLSQTISYNNYRGIGLTSYAGASLMNGMVSLGYSVSNGDGSLQWSINPAKTLSFINTGNDKEVNAQKNINHNKQNLNLGKLGNNVLNRSLSQTGGIVSTYASRQYNRQFHPTNITEYRGWALNFNLNAAASPSPVEFGIGNVGFSCGYTEQWNIATDELKAFGYMYSGEASGSDVLMDYFYEKDVPYVKNDNHIAIPFSNADNFSIAGQGLTGGFKLHNKNAGHFRPNEKSSLMVIGQLGGELFAGMNLDIGLSVGVGGHELSVEGWENSSQGYRFASEVGNANKEIDEPYFFSFNNDMGGDVSFGSTDLVKANGCSLVLR